MGRQKGARCTQYDGGIGPVIAGGRYGPLEVLTVPSVDSPVGQAESRGGREGTGGLSESAGPWRRLRGGKTDNEAIRQKASHVAPHLVGPKPVLVLKTTEVFSPWKASEKK